jgi:hypothetical protein
VPPTRLRWFVPFAALTLAALACNLPGTTPEGTAPPSSGETEMTLEEAFEVTPEDSRPEVLRLMGQPDSFTLQWQDLDGTLVRWEEWSYLDAAARFDFIDGELVWTGDLDPVVDGAIFAHAYSPMDFEPTMTIDDVRSMFPEQTFEEASLAEADIPAGVVLAGDQILLGIENGLLVYVQTFALNPDESAPTPEADAPAPTPQLVATAIASAPAALLLDDFQTATPAVPLFGAQHMTFTLEGGEGELTSLFPGGVVPVMYEIPILADFVLEVDVRFPGAQSDSIAGVIFRSDAAADGLAYYYHLAFQPAASRVTFDVWKDGAFATVTTSSLGAGVADPAGVNRLRIEADGDQIRVSVNGQFAFDVTDTRLGDPGIFGLSVVAAQSGETAYFDNLRVEALQ